jgi:hypothetical protein
VHKGDHYDGQFPGPKLKDMREWLKPSDIAARHQRLQSGRYDGTCLWATELKPIARWLNPKEDWLVQENSPSPQCLWINGKPGSGKSVLSTFLFDFLKETVGIHNRRSFGSVRCPGFGDSPACKPKVRSQILTVLYFPFISGQKFVTAISTMIHQLLKQHPDDSELQEIVEFAMAANDQPTSTSAMNLLINLVGKLPLT